MKIKPNCVQLKKSSLKLKQVFSVNGCFFVFAVFSSIALRQYLLLHGGKVSFGHAVPIAVPLAQEAQNLLEGLPHVAVSEAVDDGVDQRVALGQHQEVFLIVQHVTFGAVQTVEQQQNEAGRPADHKPACRDRSGTQKVVRSSEINTIN